MASTPSFATILNVSANFGNFIGSAFIISTSSFKLISRCLLIFMPSSHNFIVGSKKLFGSFTNMFVVAAAGAVSRALIDIIFLDVALFIDDHLGLKVKEIPGKRIYNNYNVLNHCMRINVFFIPCLLNSTRWISNQQIIGSITDLSEETNNNFYMKLRRSYRVQYEKANLIL
ncbi:hypothetical protein AGLY_001187 [Aphis glycines]|uniref:Uncharacterized protein n=1 Tax=Aphis glycines TaxID=307491 RepID=A0A6G0U992_APHGL|nr:hypothetical protein AGLY_001187 [Aphis glycines]